MNREEHDKIYQYLKTGEIPSGLESSHARFGFKRKCRSYTLDEEEDVLYYVQNHKDGSIRRRAKVVTGTVENAKAVFLEVHPANALSHPGLNRSMQQISKKYFWPRMTYDVTEWIRECPVCLKAKDTDKVKLIQLKVSEPWDILSMEIIGPINETPEGYKYIFTATDFYSKWIEAFPICNKYPAEVAACLKLIYYRHGACKSVLSDECSEFVFEVNNELTKQLSIQHHVKAVYHPNVRTFDETSSDEQRRSFLNLVMEHVFDWPHCIDGLLFTLRTKKHSVTKHTPFYLMHKREARIAPAPDTDPLACIDSEFNLNNILQPDYQSNAAKDRPADIRCHQKVIDGVTSAQNEQIIENAKSISETEQDFTVGEKVLLTNSRKRPLDASSPDFSCTGPYVVTDFKHGAIKIMCLRDYTQVKAMTDTSRLIRYKETYKLTMFEPPCERNSTISIPTT